MVVSITDYQDEGKRVREWKERTPHQIAREVSEQLQWSVIPVDQDKYTVKTGGFHEDGTAKRLSWKKYQEEIASLTTIDNWQKRYNPPAWAVVTGRVSGLVVLDYDGEKGKRTLEELGLIPHVQTGSGGNHTYFAHPGWKVPTVNGKSKEELGKRWPGLDIRADGGIAVFCGKNGSGPYQWLKDPIPYNLSILPKDLLDFLGLLEPPEIKKYQKKQYQGWDSGDLKDRLLKDALGMQGRNDSGIWLACQLRDNQFSQFDAESVMREYVQGCPSYNTKGESEPYRESDAIAALRQAYSRPAREPWKTKQENISFLKSSQNNSTAPVVDDRPEFIIEGQLIEQEAKALSVLQQSNNKDPKLFMYISMVSKVSRDENQTPIVRQIDRAGMRHELSLAARFYKMKKQDDDLVLAEAFPPKDLAEQLLALSPGEWPIPPLRAIVEAPVLRADGSILDTPGYDKKTKLYYIPSPSMEKCKVPENPTQADAIAAMNFLKPIFADFPFEGPADLANAYGLLFTPFVRYAVKKDIQIALIDATNPGTGKGLVTIIVSIVATGKTTTPMSAKKDDDEWRKAILSELLTGPRIVIIDNIRGVLESSTIEMVLTSEGINERVLGQSKIAKAKNEATWMATGNNLLVGGDLPRRSYRIRLVAQQSNPDERPDSAFTIPNLEEWTYEHRVDIVAAILTIARAWHLAGKPKPKNISNLGTFSDWAKTIGGMLEFAGVDGFQQNRDELRSRNSEEAEEWEIFLSTWHSIFGSEEKTSSEIAEYCKMQNGTFQQPSANLLFEALPQHLRRALADKPNSFCVTLGTSLQMRVQTMYGMDGYRLEKGRDKHTKAKLWSVLRRVAEGYSNPTYEKKDEFCISIANGAEINRQGLDSYPQPSATTETDTPKSALDKPVELLEKKTFQEHFAEGCEKKNNGNVDVGF